MAFYGGTDHWFVRFVRFFTTGEQLMFLIYAFVIHSFFYHTHWINEVQPVLMKECPSFCRDCKIDMINPNSTVLIDSEFYDQFCSSITVGYLPSFLPFRKSNKILFHPLNSHR